MQRITFHRLLFAFLVFMAASLAAQAQVVFTFTGTITSSEIDGYNIDDAITLTFTANNNILTAYAPGGSAYEWEEEVTSDAEIFSNVTFTGASGLWTRPDSDPAGPESLVIASDSFLTMLAGTDKPDAPLARNGLTIGAEPVNYILINGTIDAGFAYSNEHISIYDFFSSYLGAHDFSSTENEIVLINGDKMTFNLTSLNISSVPEPASFTLLAGFAGLMAALALRRSKR